MFGSEFTYQFYGVAKGSGGVNEHDVGAGQGCQALVEVVTVQNANLEKKIKYKDITEWVYHGFDDNWS